MFMLSLITWLIVNKLAVTYITWTGRETVRQTSSLHKSACVPLVSYNICGSDAPTVGTTEGHATVQVLCDRTISITTNWLMTAVSTDHGTQHIAEAVVQAYTEFRDRTVDRTGWLLHAWSSLKSFVTADGTAAANTVAYCIEKTRSIHNGSSKIWKSEVELTCTLH